MQSEILQRINCGRDLEIYDEKDVDIVFMLKEDVIKQEIREKRQDKKFRKLVEEKYGKCAISGVITEECEVAHIKPFCECLEEEKYDIRNGILLGAQIHKLFDKYFFTIHPNSLKIIVSDYAKEKNSSIVPYEGYKVDVSCEYLIHHYNKFMEKN